jgi:hypothetical protein
MTALAEAGAYLRAHGLVPAAAVRWADLPDGPRAELLDYLVALVSRAGAPVDVVALEDLILATEAWWAARQASGAAVREGVRRAYGRGRRPALKELDRRQKRQALAVGTLTKLRARLEGPTGRGNGHPAADMAAAILAVPPAGEAASS